MALADVSLAVPAGALLTVVGPSGSGKSTLLRLIAGLEAPSEGAVWVGGREVTAVAPHRRGVAMLFQSYALFPHLDVAANIGFGLRARGEAGADERVREAAQRLGLAELLGRRPAELSGGERQRVALARALVARPDVLLLDEPLSNLDAPLRAAGRDEIRRVHESTGVTTVHVTHDQDEALVLGDLVAVLDRGRVEQVGTPEEVYARPASTFVAGFLGRPPMNLLPADNPLGPGVPGEIVGFRPEDVRLEASGVPAQVEVEERAGHDVVWRVRVGGHRIAVRPPRDAAASETVALRVPTEAVRRFDAETGRAS